MSTLNSIMAQTSVWFCTLYSSRLQHHRATPLCVPLHVTITHCLLTGQMELHHMSKWRPRVQQWWEDGGGLRRHIKSPLRSVQMWKHPAAQLGMDCGHAGNDVTCYLGSSSATLTSLFHHSPCSLLHSPISSLDRKNRASAENLYSHI